MSPFLPPLPLSKVNHPQQPTTTISARLPSLSTRPSAGWITERAQTSRLYQAKCNDLRVRPVASHEARFAMRIQRSNQQGVLVLKDAGLGSSAASTIVDLLRQHNGIHTLDLSGNRLRDSGTASIAKLLSPGSSIVRLDLTCNDIGAAGIEALCHALQTNDSLIMLHLSGSHGINRNHIGMVGARALASVLALRHSVLTRLDVDQNGIGADGAALLATSLVGNVSLESLNLSSNLLGPSGVKTLSAVLPSTALRQLWLSRNDIGDVGAVALAAAIAIPVPLTLLDLSCNNIGVRGARALWSALEASTTITFLDMSRNACGSPGAMRGLSALLRRRTSLKELLLSRNSISDQGGRLLGDALRKNSSVCRLDLSSNALGDAAGLSIAEALAINQSLELLNLSDNRIKDNGGVAIAQALAVNRTVTTFLLRGNGMGAVAGEALDAILPTPVLRVLDVSMNEVPYGLQISIDSKCGATKRHHRDNAFSRLTSQVKHLEVEETRLHQRIDELRRLKVMRAEHETERDALEERVNQSEADLAGCISALQAELEEKAVQVAEGEGKVISAVSRFTRIRQDKESTKRFLEDRLAREVELGERLEASIRARRSHFEDMKARLAKEFASENDRLAKAEDGLTRALYTLQWQTEALQQLGLSEALTPAPPPEHAKIGRSPRRRRN